MSVHGIEIFSKKFADFHNQYALIGGSACDLIFSNEGVQFRATKDLDIVILTDRPTKEFAKTLWEFIIDGGYTYGWINDNEVHFYRFINPQNQAFPYMIELFARHPNFILHNENSDIGPLPIDGNISSLSAILLNDAYYNFLTQGLTRIENINIVEASHLIPLKARAHIDLNNRKEIGQHVNKTDLKKHKKDVLRLITLIPSSTAITLDTQIKQDMRHFVQQILDENMCVDQLNIGMTLEEAMIRLETIYQL